MPDDEAIVKRLDALIYLTLNVARLKDLTSEQKIQELKGLGFTDVEVAVAQPVCLDEQVGSERIASRERHGPQASRRRPVRRIAPADRCPEKAAGLSELRPLGNGDLARRGHRP